MNTRMLPRAPASHRKGHLSRREFLRVAGLLGASSVKLPFLHVRASSTLRTGPYKGMTYYSTGALDWQTQKTRDTIDRLASDGVEWLSLCDYYWQDSLSSSTIYFDSAHSHTDSDIAYVVDYAHSKGMMVMLKPHVDLKTAEQYRWQIGTGYGAPQWTEWFGQYRAFIMRYARLAALLAVELLCVGTELDGTDLRADDWQAVVADVRALYSGPLTYACNTGHLTSIGWWSSVDIIGVDAYFVLTNTNAPTLQQLLAAWEPCKTACRDASAANGGRKVLLTECGYTNSDGCNQRPWVSGSVRDDEEQRLCYEALFEACWAEPWFLGTFWWAVAPWDNYPISGIGWNPLGLPAEQTLREWYAATVPTPEPTSKPTATSIPAVDPTATQTSTLTPVPTDTPMLTSTPTPEPSPTLTPIPRKKKTRQPASSG